MALPTLNTITAPTNGNNRSVEEPKITTSIANTNTNFNNLYRYLDKTGATYPSGLNTGLEQEYLANKAVKSVNFFPNAGSGTFGTGETTLTTFNSVFVSNVISIVVPADNMKVSFFANFHWAVDAGATSGSNISEVEFYMERFTNVGTPVPGGGLEVQTTPSTRPSDRSGKNDNYLIGVSSIAVTDTVTTAGTYRYYFLARESSTIVFNRKIRRWGSRYFYILSNDFATS